MSLCSLALGGLIMLNHPDLKNSGPTSGPIKVAYTTPWKSVHPGLQHTAIADLVLSNQFEALVGSDNKGVHIPLAAKSWDANSDLSIYTFEIDTTRRFSDGTYLSSYDFKRSWEQALSLVPKSANSSLADVLFMLVGIEDFEAKGQISGIETPDEKTLILKFKKTFRAALDYLRGNRFAAFKENGDSKFIGTGNFIIEEISESKILMKRNSFAINDSTQDEFEILYMGEQDLAKSFQDGSIDIYPYGVGSRVKTDFLNQDNLEVHVGQDAINEALYLNSLQGRVFEDKNLRQALLFLISSELKLDPNGLVNSEFFKYDPQLFLPFQMGRIDEDTVSSIINMGEKYLGDLIKASHSRPLIVYYNSTTRGIINILEKYGIKIDDMKSREATSSEHLDNYYKSFVSDISVGAYSVAGTDPDSVYHKFGFDGAISSPMTNNTRLSSILELGRNLISPKEIEKHYQQASIVFLEEAPIVHLGFTKAIAVYRSDRVGFNKKILRRNEGQLYPFYKK